MTSRTFSSLALRNYRLFFIGQLVSVAGTWMQTVAQAWLVLDLSHSGTALGLVTAARFLPMLVLGPWGGLIADRLDKRRVLYVTQTLSALLALALALLVASGGITLWMVYALALGLGFVNVFDNPVRQSFISELVPVSELRNAVTLNSVTVNMARIIGPALAGLLIASVGIAACFAVNAASFAAVLLSLGLMNARDLHREPPEPRRRGQLRDGLRYVSHAPELAIPLVMVAVVGTLAWEFQVSLPLLARSTFHGDAGTYGLMMTAMGIGAVVGGAITARRPSPAPTSLAVSSIGWGVSIMAAALAPSLLAEYFLLLFVGFGSISFNSIAKTWLQLTTAPALRGRVMALWSVAWLGSTPIGGPIVGWVGQNVGARWSVAIGGVAALATGLVAHPLLSRVSERSRERDARATTASERDGPTGTGSRGRGVSIG